MTILNTREEVADWLDKYGIVNYTIAEDLSVDVHVDIIGSFHCSNNELLSLLGGPIKVSGNFYCFNNKLASLLGGPIEVGEDFYCFACDENQLTSLSGSPKNVVGDFACNNNQLRSLEYCPTEVLGFCCSDNILTSLKYGPLMLDILIVLIMSCLVWNIALLELKVIFCVLRID